MRAASSVPFFHGAPMSFELVVEINSEVKNLRKRWQDEINSHGFSIEIDPTFKEAEWEGFLPIKVTSLPDKYLFGLPNVVQISGFEVDLTPDAAMIRTAMGRTLAELILQCYGAATLAVITDGLYHDPQTGESFEGAAAIERADWEIRQYVPYIDEHARVQHPFTDWSDYG